MFYKDEKTLFLIDGANLFSASRSLQFEIDYALLKAELSKRCRFVRALYYTSIIDSEEYSPVRPLVDWLNYNGYVVRSKIAKEYTDAHGRRKIKGNFNVDLTIDALDHADRVDHVVLFSGDGDFTPLVTALQRRGVRVSVVSTLASPQAMVSDELRRQADVFIELDDLRDLIGRAITESETAK